MCECVYETFENNFAMIISMNFYNMTYETWDFLGGPVAKTPHSQCRGPKFAPWSGNSIQHDTRESLHAVTKEPQCHNEKQRPHVPRQRPLKGQ